MKQKISTLMDGELCGDEAEVLLAKIRLHPEAQQEWSTYHLIGDVLRQPDYLASNVSAAFLERLHAEPTVLAPHGKHDSKAGLFAMSAVASIMAIAWLAWLSLTINPEPAFQQAQRSNVLPNTSVLTNASFPASEQMNDYLLAHQEFSPGTDVRGAASYIRTVAARQTVAGK